MNQYELIGNQCGGLIDHGGQRIIPWGKLMDLINEHGEPLLDCDKTPPVGVCPNRNCTRNV